MPECVLLLCPPLSFRRLRPPPSLSRSAVFIQELTARAHLVSLGARRRTVSRADVAQAVSRSDAFDFLIVSAPSLLSARASRHRLFVNDATHAPATQDIVPRTEQRAAASTSNAGAPGSGSGSTKRPSRSRKHSQRDSPADGAGGMVEDSGAAGAGGADGEADDVGEPSRKRPRFDDGQQQPGQPGAFAAMDPAQAAAVVAAAAGYYLPQGLADGAVRPEVPLCRLSSRAQARC